VLEGRLSCAHRSNNNVLYLQHHFLLLFYPIVNILLNPLKDGSIRPLMALIINLVILVELKHSLILGVDSVVSQMHKEVVKILFRWNLVRVSTEPCKTFFVQVNP
jgi:hypothetical protein